MILEDVVEEQLLEESGNYIKKTEWTLILNLILRATWLKKAVIPYK